MKEVKHKGKKQKQVKDKIKLIGGFNNEQVFH